MEKIARTAPVVLTAVIASTLCLAPALAKTAPAKPSPSPSIASPELVEHLDRVELNWSKGTIEITGLGVAPDRGPLSQRRALARREAYLDAFQGLSEGLDQVRVNGEAILRDLAVGEPTVRPRLDAFVRDASSSEPKLLPDGSVEVKMSLSLYGAKGLAGLLFASNPPVATVSCPVTGIVLDARASGAQPALSPQIRTLQGKVLFPVGADTAALNAGALKYYHTPEAAKAAMGAKPLVLKARASAGATRADLVLDDSSSKEILPAIGCLQRGDVAIVL